MADLHWRRGVALILLTPALLLWAPISYGYWTVQALVAAGHQNSAGRSGASRD